MVFPQHALIKIIYCVSVWSRTLGKLFPLLSCLFLFSFVKKCYTSILYLRTVPGVPPVEPGRDKGCLFGEGVPFTVPGNNQIKLDYDITMFFFVGSYSTELSADQGKHWWKIIQRILLP